MESSWCSWQSQAPSDEKHQPSSTRQLLLPKWSPACGKSKQIARIQLAGLSTETSPPSQSLMCEGPKQALGRNPKGSLHRLTTQSAYSIGPHCGLWSLGVSALADELGQCDSSSTSEKLDGLIPTPQRLYHQVDHVPGGGNLGSEAIPEHTSSGRCSLLLPPIDPCS